LPRRLVVSPFSGNVIGPILGDGYVDAWAGLPGWRCPHQRAVG
jgi:hypothetical protein